MATGSETEQVERRGDKDRRRGGSVVGPALAIIAGAAVLSAAAALVPLAAAISTGMIALVWWSLLSRKPHVRRTELLASGGGAAVVLWLIVFALPHMFGFFRQEGPARDAQGELLELPPDLQPAPVEPDRLAWLDNMAAVGVLAAIGLCMVGWGWRTLRRRRGRRRGSRRSGSAAGAAGGTATTTGEHTPVTPVGAMGRFGAGAAPGSGGAAAPPDER